MPAPAKAEAGTHRWVPASAFAGAAFRGDNGRVRIFGAWYNTMEIASPGFRWGAMNGKPDATDQPHPLTIALAAGDFSIS